MQLSDKSKISTILSLFFYLLTSLTCLFFWYFYFVKNDKIAYVDSGKIFAEYKGAADAKKAYQVKAKVWQANVDTLTSQVQKAIKSYEKSVASSSDVEQRMAKELITAKQNQLRDYQRAIQDNAQQEDAKLSQKVIAQINGFLSDYGKKHNYKLILIANASGTIAYAREGLDITGDVIDVLNKTYIPEK